MLNTFDWFPRNVLRIVKKSYQGDIWSSLKKEMIPNPSKCHFYNCIWPKTRPGWLGYAQNPCTGKYRDTICGKELNSALLHHLDNKPEIFIKVSLEVDCIIQYVLDMVYPHASVAAVSWIYKDQILKRMFWKIIRETKATEIQKFPVTTLKMWNGIFNISL